MTDPEPSSEFAWRRRCYELYLEQQATLDKILVTVSSGGIGVTIVFWRDMVQSSGAIALGLLFFAWAAWALSICFALRSHALSAHDAFEASVHGPTHKRVESGAAWRDSDRVNSWARHAFLAGVVLTLLVAVVAALEVRVSKDARVTHIIEGAKTPPIPAEERGAKHPPIPPASPSTEPAPTSPQPTKPDGDGPK